MSMKPEEMPNAAILEELLDCILDMADPGFPETKRRAKELHAELVVRVESLEMNEEHMERTLEETKGELDRVQKELEEATRQLKLINDTFNEM